MQSESGNDKDVAGLNRPMLCITAPHFVAAVVLDEGTVVRAAPIVHYMIDWDMETVVKYCKSKNWKVEFVE